METPAVFESADQGEAAQHQAGQAWEAFRLDPEKVAIPSYPVCVYTRPHESRGYC
jgi:hypothetical protein